MVASKHEDRIWKGDFQGKYNCHHLDREMSTINIITEEQIGCFSWISTRFRVDNFQKIIVLSMNITNNSNRIFYLYRIGLVLYAQSKMILKIVCAWLMSARRIYFFSFPSRLRNSFNFLQSTFSPTNTYPSSIDFWKGTGQFFTTLLPSGSGSSSIVKYNLYTQTYLYLTF